MHIGVNCLPLHLQPLRHVCLLFAKQVLMSLRPVLQGTSTWWGIVMQSTVNWVIDKEPTHPSTAVDTHQLRSVPENLFS
jgi:hypothetical protein